MPYDEGRLPPQISGLPAVSVSTPSSAMKAIANGSP